MSNFINYKGNFKIDFAIVGQPKSGTTALANFLSQHPQICFSNPKEPGFFASDIIQESDTFHGRKRYFKFRNLRDYRKIFDCKENTLLGEATTSYAYSKTAARNIYTNNPNAKIIIMLRGPVDFLHSLHKQMVNEDIENADFETALELEPTRKAGKHLPGKVRYPSALYYSERVKYSDHVKKFFDLFDRQNVKVFIMEEFKQDNHHYFREVADFLDIDTSFKPQFSLVHESKTPRFGWLNKLVNALWLKNLLFAVLGAKRYTALGKKVTKLTLKQAERAPIRPELRNKLNKTFKREVVKLEKLLDKDLLKLWKMG